MSDEQIGWEVQGRFYPHVGHAGLTHGDYALIREVTGLDLDQFDRGTDNLAVETGWLAVAVWHGNPEMRRDQILQFIEQLPGDAQKRVGWKVELEADPTPLDESGDPTPSPDSGPPSSSSNSSPAGEQSSASPSTTRLSEESSPAPLSLLSSGSPPSATGATSPQPTSDPSVGAAA